MNNLSDTQRGFTLIEVLVSVGIMLIFLVFAASMLTNSRLLASYSKHKIQAAYAAQQIIETQRQIISTYFTSPLGPLTAGKSDTVGPSWVILDTKGNYTNLNCTPGVNPNILCGQATITVTPAVYTSQSGTTTTSTTTDHFVVQIYWLESGLFPMTETYAEDIANDPMLN